MDRFVFAESISRIRMRTNSSQLSSGLHSKTRARKKSRIILSRACVSAFCKFKSCKIYKFSSNISRFLTFSNNQWFYWFSDDVLSICLCHTVLSFSLVVFEKCWVCWPVGSQPAAEWIRLDSPCIWPFVPSLDFGLKSFLLAAPGAVAHSKTSLLGCCWPSVSPRHSSKPLPAGSYLAHEAPQCCVKGRCRHSPFKKWIVGKKLAII